MDQVRGEKLRIGLLTCALLAGCTSAGNSEQMNGGSFTPHGVDSIPVLVRFKGNCPLDTPDKIVELVKANCEHPAKDAKAGDVCRSRNSKMWWLAVKDAPAPPYEPLEVSYQIEFVDPHDNPLNDASCKNARGGWVRCQISGGAKQQHWYEYKVTAANCPGADPRIWVQ